MRIVELRLDPVVVSRQLGHARPSSHSTGTRTCSIGRDTPTTSASGWRRLGSRRRSQASAEANGHRALSTLAHPACALPSRVFRTTRD
jgi:hypothetical protein